VAWRQRRRSQLSVGGGGSQYGENVAMCAGGVNGVMTTGVKPMAAMMAI